MWILNSGRVGVLVYLISSWVIEVKVVDDLEKSEMELCGPPVAARDYRLLFIL